MKRFMIAMIVATLFAGTLTGCSAKTSSASGHKNACCEQEAAGAASSCCEENATETKKSCCD